MIVLRWRTSNAIWTFNWKVAHKRLVVNSLVQYTRNLVWWTHNIKMVCQDKIYSRLVLTLYWYNLIPHKSWPLAHNELYLATSRSPFMCKVSTLFIFILLRSTYSVIAQYCLALLTEVRHDIMYIMRVQNNLVLVLDSYNLRCILICGVNLLQYTRNIVWYNIQI